MKKLDEFKLLMCAFSITLFSIFIIVGIIGDLLGADPNGVNAVILTAFVSLLVGLAALGSL